MKNLLIVALVGMIAIVGGLAYAGSVDTTVDVEVTVWKHVDSGRIYLSTRPADGVWTTHNTPIDLSNLHPQYPSWYQGSAVTVPVEVPDQPASTDPASSSGSTNGFSISGSGNDVRTVSTHGQLICRAEVRDNYSTYGSEGTNFIVQIIGSGAYDSELLANEIGVTVNDSAVVDFGGDGIFALSPPYHVEVDATGSWTVSCR